MAFVISSDSAALYLIFRGMGKGYERQMEKVTQIGAKLGVRSTVLRTAARERGITAQPGGWLRKQPRNSGRSSMSTCPRKG